VGEHAVLHPHVTLGAEVRVGDRTVLHPGVRVQDRCEIGDDCILHPGAVIGADGFGYHPSPDGKGLLKVPHIGTVIVGRHVEIGANACIDRAKFGATTIGEGTKIDNLVQIGHGCRVGRSCILCGHAALAGSVTLGDGVILGGKVGVADGIEIGAGAKVAAGSGITNTVPPGATYMGNPAGPAGEWRRMFAAMRRLGKRPSAVEP
jgi:UDP-3-O-[3-hydroxymyristoyl] glucosamine N-acyltransferase